MRVLGVDPGLTRCGLGVVDGLPGRRAAMVAVGVVRTPAADDLSHRLLRIADEIEAWLREHRPDVLAVERVFSQSNVSTVMGTAQVSGVAVVAAARLGVPVALHTPSEVKAAVTGSGRAGKDQVTTMVTRILALPERPTPADAADALALALCHLWRGGAAAGGAGATAVAGATGPASATAGARTPAQEAWALATRQAATRSARGFAVPDEPPAAGPGSAGGRRAAPARRVTSTRRPG